jgi:hypothetical protein
MQSAERGQSTVEWVGSLCVVTLLMAALLDAGVRLPGVGLVRMVGERILCGAAFAGGCGDRPRLIGTYGSEVGKLVREHMPTLMFEQGSRALPIDFRRCRAPTCADGTARGLVHRSDRGLPVTAFTHVVDCRGEEADRSLAEGVDCSGARANALYLQYWLYYADSATLRAIPVVGEAGYHPDDWESVQIRLGPDGRVDQRASSHAGYNYERSIVNWGSDAEAGLLRRAAERLGGRERGGWGAETGLLLVSGGSHAGNAIGIPHVDRFTPGRRVHLVPLEPIAAVAKGAFAVGPPWLKQVWRDPEAASTG